MTIDINDRNISKHDSNPVNYPKNKTSPLEENTGRSHNNVFKNGVEGGGVVMVAMVIVT